MNEPDNTDFLIGGGIGMALTVAGFYAFNRTNPPIAVRLALGAMMLAAGLCSMFYWPGILEVAKNPLYLGLTVPLIGVGLNQLGAPLRRALGRSI